MYTIIIIQVGWRKQNISLGRYDVNSADVCWHFCQHSICLSSFHFAAFAFSAQISFHLFHQKGDIWNCSNFSEKIFTQEDHSWKHERLIYQFYSFNTLKLWNCNGRAEEQKWHTWSASHPQTCILRSDQERWLFKWSAWNIWFCRCQTLSAIFCNLIWCENTKHCQTKASHAWKNEKI